MDETAIAEEARRLCGCAPGTCCWDCDNIVKGIRAGLRLRARDIVAALEKLRDASYAEAERARKLSAGLHRMRAMTYGDAIVVVRSKYPDAFPATPGGEAKP
jgi:hypothetical protein